MVHSVDTDNVHTSMIQSISKARNGVEGDEISGEM